MSEAFVKPGEARDFVLATLEAIISRYEVGLLSYSDIYYIIKNEPLLSEEEKQLLLSSPSLLTMRKIRGLPVEAEIMGKPLPSNAVIVPQHKLLSLQIAREYRHLGIVRSNRVEPWKIINIFKAVSTLTLGKWPSGVSIFLAVDKSVKNRDLLALVLFFTRYYRIPVYSSIPVLFQSEQGFDELEARLGYSDDSVVIDVSAVRTGRALKILSFWAHRNNAFDVVESFFGIKREELPKFVSDWWKMIDVEEHYDRELEQQALEAGLARIHASRMARWRLRSPADCASFLLSLLEEGMPRDYVEKAARLCSARINYPVDVIVDNTYRLFRGEKVRWE